ncbi:MAG: hypothetical protein KDA60_12225 [Planctomycetales bacterium]|nr:hypothetical protein [Planctomycetales bacterium]
MAALRNLMICALLCGWLCAPRAAASIMTVELVNADELVETTSPASGGTTEDIDLAQVLAPMPPPAWRVADDSTTKRATGASGSSGDVNNVTASPVATCNEDEPVSWVDGDDGRVKPIVEFLTPFRPPCA